MPVPLGANLSALAGIINNKNMCKYIFIFTNIYFYIYIYTYIFIY